MSLIVNSRSSGNAVDAVVVVVVVIVVPNVVVVGVIVPSGAVKRRRRSGGGSGSDVASLEKFVDQVGFRLAQERRGSAGREVHFVFAAGKMRWILC